MMGDLLFFVKLLKKEKKTLFITSFICVCIGIGYVLLTPNKYIAKTVFITEIPKGAGGADLGSLAAMAGIQIGSGNQTELIRPNLYKEIINSNKFLYKIINVELKDPLDGRFKKFKEIYKSEDNDINDSIIVDYDAKVFKVSDIDYSLFQMLKQQIKINYIKEDNKFIFSVENRNAELAASLLVKCKNILQATIIQYKLDRIKKDFEFIEENFKEKKKVFLTKQIELAKFQDRNRSLLTMSSQANLTKLKSEYNLAFTLYTELAKKVELQKLKIKENRPIFITINEVSVPNKKSSPITRNVLIISLLLGVLIGTLIIMINDLKNNKKWII